MNNDILYTQTVYVVHPKTLKEYKSEFKIRQKDVERVKNGEKYTYHLNKNDKLEKYWYK